MLSNLPPEILQQIIALACADGGRAAASLLQCSHYISSVTRPYRFQTVAVVRSFQVNAFLQSFLAARKQDGPSVYVDRLFVADRTEAQAANLPTTAPRAARSQRVEEAESWRRILEELLRCVGLRLRVLTILIYQPFFWRALNCLLDADFPILEECSMVCKAPAPAVPFTPYPLRPFPRLRILRLGLRGNMMGYYTFLERIAERCTQNVHLILRDCFDSAPDTIRLARTVLGDAGDLLWPLPIQTPFAHVTVWPNTWPNTWSTEQHRLPTKHQDRITVMPVKSIWRPYAEWKEECF
jgi:hypothetical protein